MGEAVHVGQKACGKSLHLNLVENLKPLEESKRLMTREKITYKNKVALTALA